MKTKLIHLNGFLLKANNMKTILLLISVVLLSGCTTATNYTEFEKQMNNGHPPKMLFGMKVYPEYAKSILFTPMTLTPEAARSSMSSTTYINTTTTIRHSNGTTTTYTTKGYVR
jgi:hypothetical protein